METSGSLRTPDGLWKVVGASVTGAGHHKKKIPCQNTHAWLRVREDWVTIAVADGAGSAPLSDRGARAVVNRALIALRECVSLHVDGTNYLSGSDEWRRSLQDVLIICRGALELEAAARGRRARDLSCTLMLAVFGPQLGVALQVGDGAIVLQYEDGSIEALTRPYVGEVADETVYLDSPRALYAAQFAFCKQPVRSAAVFTNAIRNLALKSQSSESFSFFERLFTFFHRENDMAAAATELEKMLSSQQVRKYTDDDVTLVIASRRHMTC